MTKKGRNGRIEFFRFVFAMIVMIFHGKNVMNDGKSVLCFPDGWVWNSFSWSPDI